MIKTVLIALLLAPLASATAFADKDFVTADEGTSWDCGKDPVANVMYGKGTFTFTGACTEVNINGSEVKVTIESTATLNVNGDKNTVTVAEVGAININGTANKATWTKAKTGQKPTTATNGTGNAVVKAPAAKAKK